jgi:two-component system, OmpR family, response regulator
MEPQKILIIEDEPEIRLLLSMCLKLTGGFQTVEASDGLEGIEAARQESPDLILIDVMMPRLDGYTTCRLIKQDEDLKNIPVIFLTAKTDRREVSKAIRAGACGCLSKPFDPMTLSDQIRSIMEGAKKVGHR